MANVGAPDTPASPPGFGARRGIHPGPMKDEECCAITPLGAKSGSGGCDPIASENARRGSIPFEKHTDD